MSDPETWCEDSSASSSLTLAFQQYAHELQRFLLHRLGCPDTAADLVQETFLRVAQLKPAPSPDNPRAFLFKIASNLAIDQLRKNQVRKPFQTSLDDAEHLASAAPSGDQAFFDKQRMAMLQQALEELPSRCRAVFVMRRLQGYSYDEIARRLNMSERAVAKDINRALAHCQQTLLAKLTEQS